MRQLLVLSAMLLVLGANGQQVFTLTVENKSSSSRTDQPVVLSLQEYGLVASALVTECSKAGGTEGKEVPCQLDDLDLDEQMDELCFLSDLGPREKKTYKVYLSGEGAPRPYPARVYAEMVMGNKNVKEKNKQDNFIEAITARGDCAYSYNLQHHHGVDFESELNGIRIYFDKRQTLDLYGKFKKRLELQDTQFYTSDEQKQQGYGDDVLWVGNTFGLGAFRGWDGQQPTMVDPVKSRTQRIISYGPLRTIVEVIDRGWQIPGQSPLNMTLRYIQYAGHRDTDVEVMFNRDATRCHFSTGIINVKGSEEFSDKKGLRACWGTDYPATDTLKWKRETVGLAILIPKEFIVSEQPANSDNYAFVVSPRQSSTGKGQSSMSYKVAYCSDNEEFGYHNAQQWFNWLKAWRKEVESPLVIDILR